MTHNVKRGRFVRKYAEPEHHDHVHVAVDRGVDLDREDPREPVDAVRSPQGGLWVLTRDDGIRTYECE